jgi:polysaccharide transporter, PST family
MPRNMLDELNPAFRKILGNTGWLMVDRVVRMGLGLFVGVWVARYLGPEEFGSLNFAVSFVALFATLTTFGLEGMVARNIILDAHAAPEILGTAFALRMSGSILAPLLAIASIRLIQPNDSTVLILVSLLSIGLIFQAFDTIDSYFQSQVLSKLTVWAKNAAFLALAAVRILLVHFKAPLWSFAAAQVVESALGAIGLVLVYRWGGGRLSNWSVRKWRAIQLLRQSWPIMLTGMAIVIYMRIDMIMLKLMQGDSAVGIYATATRVSEVWYFIPMAIVSSVAPAIIRAKDYASPRIYYARIARLFSLMSFLAIVIGSGVAICSHWIITGLYSDEFRAAAPVLAVHVWASVFVFLGLAQGPWNMAENLLKLGFYRTLAGAAVNVLLNLILIPRFSALGAAIATVVSYAIAGVFANAFDVRTRPIFFLQLKSFIPSKFWKSEIAAD